MSVPDGPEPRTPPPKSAAGTRAGEVRASGRARRRGGARRSWACRRRGTRRRRGRRGGRRGRGRGSRASAAASRAARRMARSRSRAADSARSCSSSVTRRCSRSVSESWASVTLRRSVRYLAASRRASASSRWRRGWVEGGFGHLGRGGALLGLRALGRLGLGRAGGVGHGQAPVVAATVKPAPMGVVPSVMAGGGAVGSGSSVAAVLAHLAHLLGRVAQLLLRRLEVDDPRLELLEDGIGAHGLVLGLGVAPDGLGRADGSPGIAHGQQAEAHDLLPALAQVERDAPDLAHEAGLRRLQRLTATAGWPAAGPGRSGRGCG